MEDDYDSSDSEYWSDQGEPTLPGEPTEGGTFPSASAVLHSVQDHALKQGKRVKLASHGGTDRHIVCTSAPTCKFSVRAYRRSKIIEGKRLWLDMWQISSVNLKHNDCFSTAKPTQRQIAIMKSFSSALRSGAAVHAGALVEHVRESSGVSLSRMKRTVYRAMDRVRQEDEGDILQSYGKIPSYLEAFASENPGTIAVAEKDEASRFKRAAVVVGAFANAREACQRVVGLDCSHSKSRFFSGVQVHLVGRDGNLKNITLAFGLVPAEDHDSYMWFLDKVSEAGFDVSDIPIFCGVFPLYGWRTSNFVESVFGTQLVSGMRRLAPYDFIKRLCEKLVTDCYSRSTLAQQLKAQGSFVTPGAMKLFEAQSENLGAYLVIRSCNDVSYVTNRQASIREQRRVTLSAKKCTCTFMDQYEAPCRHLIASLAEQQREGEIPKYFASYYHVNTFHDAFAGAAIRLPLDTDVFVDPTWLPPPVKQRTGRPKAKRFRSRGEENFK